MLDLEINHLSLRFASLRIDEPVRRARMTSSIARHGQLTPVLVQGDVVEPVLIDGYARVEALQSLGQDFVKALKISAPLVDAIALGHRLGHGRRRSALEEGWLLQVLVDEHGVARRDLAFALERSASWVSRRLGLVETLPVDVQDAVRRGALSPQAAMKSLLPLARANARDCSRLVERLMGSAMSVRQLDRIYRAWRRGSASQRLEIIEHPQLFLRAQDAVQSAREAGGLAPTAALEMERLAAKCQKLAAKLTTNEFFDAGELDRLDNAWTRFTHSFAALTARMDDLDARPRHAHRNSPTRADEGPGDAADRQDPGRVPERSEARACHRPS